MSVDGEVHRAQGHHGHLHVANRGTPQRSYEFFHCTLLLHVDKRRQQQNPEDTIEAKAEPVALRSVRMPVTEKKLLRGI